MMTAQYSPMAGTIQIAAHRDGEGWSAETAIPLKTLSFDPARDAWGLNITRWHGRDNEQYGWESFNRTQNLSRGGGVSPQELDAARTAQMAAQANDQFSSCCRLLTAAHQARSRSVPRNADT